MKGPKPKNPATRQRRNKPVTAATLPPDPPPPPRGGKARKVPPLPRRRGKGNGWSALSRDYWREIWSSPMAKKFLRADLGGLYILIDLHERYWRASAAGAPVTSLAAELRLQRDCFGLTTQSRARLHWGVADETPPSAPPGPPATTPAPPSVDVAPPRAAAGADPRKLLTMVPRA